MVVFALAVIYLDNNATTQPAAEVVAAVTHCLEQAWANPSSAHRAGMAARRVLEVAREQVANLVGSQHQSVVFTSGGTESANLAVIGGFVRAHAVASARRFVLLARTEHPAVRDAAVRCGSLGAEVLWVPVDSQGVVSLSFLEDVLAQRGDEIALLSLMWVNNETGVRQPIKKVASMCRARGVLMHTDAVQLVGREPCDFAAAGVDLLSLSGHKFHGVKGAGALVVRPGVSLEPRALGGSQERARRGGTENMPGVCGLGEAARLAASWMASGGVEQMTALRDRFEKALQSRLEGVHIHSSDAPRVCNTANIGFDGVQAQFLLVVLSEHGVAASGGAACASGAIEASDVLGAMGCPDELARGSVRFSLARTTTQDDIDCALERIVAAVSAQREGPSSLA